jgi:hypothetical protein
MFPGLYADVVNALLRGTIELKRAELILRALNTAVRNIKRVKFDLHSDELVRGISDYPAPPRTRRANRAGSARATAAYLAECRAELGETVCAHRREEWKPHKRSSNERKHE